MGKGKKVFEYEDLDSMDLNYEQDLASAYKPVDELFDTLILEDDGYEDFKSLK